MAAQHAIRLAHFLCRTRHTQVALFDPYCLVAQALNLIVVVRNDEHRHAMLFDQLRDAVFALLLEHEVAYGKYFVNDQNLRHDNRSNRKGNARHHAGRVVLHRHVQELFHLGKFNDVVEVFFNELLRIAQKRAVQVNVFARGKLHIEARTKLDERSNVTINRAQPFAGLQHAGDDLQNGRFTRAVSAQNAKHIALLHFKGNIVECAEFLKAQFALSGGDYVFFDAVQLFACHVEDHGHMVHLDHGFLRRVVGELGFDFKNAGVHVFGHGCSLNVENELLFGLLENKQTDGECSYRHAKAQEVFLQAWHRAAQDKVAEIAYVVKHGVVLH